MTAASMLYFWFDSQPWISITRYCMEFGVWDRHETGWAKQGLNGAGSEGCTGSIHSPGRRKPTYMVEDLW